jgi:hypothetical protein
MNAPLWIGAGGVLGALAAIWAVTILVVFGRSGGARWRPHAAVLASLAVVLPLLTSSLWLIQAPVVVARATPGAKLDAVAVAQRLAFEPVVVVVAALLLIGLATAVRGRAGSEGEAWLGAGAIGFAAAAVTATWLGGLLLALAGFRALAVMLWLATLVEAWLALFGALAHGVTGAIRTWRAA